MPACARHEIVEREEVGVYHCTSRCVRRAFLCGRDEYSGKDYSHRRQWVHRRIRQMAAVFMVDVLGYAIMENHFHSKLRIRPDLALKLSDREVARRSLMLNARTLPEEQRPPEPDEQRVVDAMKTEGYVDKWRARLSDLSWFMRFLKEPIARLANKEDEVTGSFWQGRFDSVHVLDDVGALLCSTYVELNEVRAGKATTPEESTNSSIHERAETWKRETQSEIAQLETAHEAAIEGLKAEPTPDFLAPVYVGSDNGTRSGSMTEEQPDPHRLRPSNSGFLPVTLPQFLSLVDWAGRCVKEGKRGAIPNGLDPILNRLVQNLDAFLLASQEFGKLFKRVCGSPESLEAYARKKGLKRIPGIKLARSICSAI